MIQRQLFEETRVEDSYAAIVRGLIELGLNQVEGAPRLTVIFAGCRMPRGRKPGGKVATAVVPLDLTQGDMDLEFEDEHHDDRLPKPKKEVVARRRVRRRLRPIRAAAPLEPAPPKYDDDDEEPETTPPCGSVLDNEGDDMWGVFYRNRVLDPDAAARLKEAKARGDAAYEQWQVERLEVEKAQRAKKGQSPPDK
ncbi:MAG: hypothetical protein ACMG6S_20820 [Byssovorax sp.]